MSFRGRLTLFFVLIVIVPMLSVAIVLFRLISDNETGKADAGLRAQQVAAIRLFDQSRTNATASVTIVGRDRVLAQSLRAGDRARAAKRARQLLRSRGIARIAITGGATTIDVGSRRAVAPASRRLIDAGGKAYGVLSVSVEDGPAYVAEVKQITTLEVVARPPSGPALGTTLAAAAGYTGPSPGKAADAELEGRRYRVASFERVGFGDVPVRVTVLSKDARRASAVARSRLLAGGILLGFLVLALTFAIAVSRSLQAQIASFLAAARRLAGGDFSTDVPTTGNDEFAELAAEFNVMAGLLQGRLTDLETERARLQNALRRIGASFASNLDRDALLELVISTAVDGLGASAGRARARVGEGELKVIAQVGDEVDVHEALTEAEAAALRFGEAGESVRRGAHALAYPLRGPDESDDIQGVVAVARKDEPFSEQERELFAYLASAVAVSVENVGLHEAVARQAVTDELTGLYNHRRFQEAMGDELERARRFEQPLGLVMLDIDNFKSVNDTYGHQQGDRVLSEVARVLRETSREIDSPARYGGEELAVVLPQTDMEGAYNLAERVRTGIEELRFEVAPELPPLHVTASLGVAALAQHHDEAGVMIAEADAALYRAKRAGKNRTVRSDGSSR